MKKTQLFTKLKNLPWFPICLVLLVIIFFSVRLIITWDSAHYLGYVEIFAGNLPASSWDIVRGPIFPALIYIFGVLFGKTGTGILIGTFIFYLIFAIVCYRLCRELCQNYKHTKLIQNILLAVLILNPLVLGYFHILLTEFVAITMTMLNILLAYKWLSCDLKNKKHLILYALCFVFSILFCYHLKQPYLTISFGPFIIAIIISIVQNHTLINVLYRLGTFCVSLVFLFLSVVSWNAILRAMDVDLDSGRDSSSMFSQQILNAYQISYDQNNPPSTADTVGILFHEFITDPINLIATYAKNYCGLTSICAVSTEDSVNYVATAQLAGFSTYENTIIGYRPYQNISNIFPISSELSARATVYGESSTASLIARSFNLTTTPTNILFKLATLGCLPALIVVLVYHHKDRRRHFQKIFYLNIILLSTASIHMILSAGVGLVIDRYAVEIFVPSLLGIFGTVTYIYLVHQQPHTAKKLSSHAKS